METIELKDKLRTSDYRRRQVASARFMEIYREGNPLLKRLLYRWLTLAASERVDAFFGCVRKTMREAWRRGFAPSARAAWRFLRTESSVPSELRPGTIRLDCAVAAYSGTPREDEPLYLVQPLDSIGDPLGQPFVRRESQIFDDMND